MPEKNLGRNYALNAINTVGGVAFYMITFPYAARVLGPDCIGQVNFFRAIVTYISLVSCLGIPLYGVREIAGISADDSLRRHTAREIMLLHLLLTLLAMLLVAVLCFAVPQIRHSAPLFLILASSLLFTAIGCEWFFSGIEDFGYITARGIAVRIVYAVVLFCFVKSPADVMLYAALTVFGTYGSHVFNLIRFRQLGASCNYRMPLHPLRHLKPVAKVFGITAVSAIYVNLNVVILGFISGDTAVGYFTAAMKLIIVPLGLLTALQTTLLPRVSAMLTDGRSVEYNALFDRSLNYVWRLGLPLGAGLTLLAEPLISLFCGEEYRLSATVLRILAPMLVIIAVVCVLNAAVFIPLRLERLATRACMAGAVVSLAVNLLLIPHMEQNGAAWASVAAELAVMLCMAFYMKRELGKSIVGRCTLYYIAATAVMAAAVMYLYKLSDAYIWRLAALPAIGACVYYMLVLFGFKTKICKP